VELVGIDVGGSTIKLARVNVDNGVIADRILSAPTPPLPSLANVVDAIGSLCSSLPPLDKGQRFGVALPAIIDAGQRSIGVGLAPDWHSTEVLPLLRARIGQEAVLLNDADAAGLAEMRFGYAAESAGTVIVLTLGTFIGSALFHAGRLIPNVELGQLEVGGRSVEGRLGGKAKLERKIGWPAWADEFNLYLDRLDAWFSPSLIVLAGGMTRQATAFAPLLHPRCPLRISRFADAAGVVGAALHAANSEPVRFSAALGR